jgi:hypothetical protein
VSGARQIFREDLLRGRSIALSGATADPVRELLQLLGARLTELDPELAADEEAVFAWARAAGPLDALLCSDDGHGDLLTGIWVAVRAVATETFIPRGAGRVVLLAARHDSVAAAALENLARTLSVEWARFGITTTAIAPGPTTTDEELAQLVAFLSSPAGAYFSGCRFDLGLVERGNRGR